jgi:hypothetical protein
MKQRHDQPLLFSEDCREEWGEKVRSGGGVEKGSSFAQF